MNMRERSKWGSGSVRSRCVELKKAIQNNSGTVGQKTGLAKRGDNSWGFECLR